MSFIHHQMKPVLVGLWYADQFCRPIRGATTMKKILLILSITVLALTARGNSIVFNTLGPGDTYDGQTG